jgi:hypothetical protein
LGQTTQIADTPKGPGELPVTVLPRETEGITQLDPITAANRGTRLGDIPRLQTGSLGENIASLDAFRKGTPLVIPKGTPQTKPVRLDELYRPVQPEHIAADLAEQGKDLRPINIETKLDRIDNALVNYHEAQDELKDELEDLTHAKRKDVPNIGEINKIKGNIKELKDEVNTPINVDFDSPLRVRLQDHHLRDPEGFIYDPNTTVSPDAPVRSPLRIKDPKLAEANARIGDIGNIGEPGLPYQLPSAEPRPKAQIKATPTAETGVTISPTEPTSNAVVKTKLYRPISSATPVKDAVKQWADGRVGAAYRGKLAAEKFEDLTDPSLMDKFEAGDRTGKLKDLADYFDERHAEGVKAGLFEADQKVPNYVRHEFDNTDEEIQAAMKNYVPKNPSIAKTRGFPTYAEAEASGLKRKFNTIPEMVEAYERKFSTALRDKEFYDYLSKTKQIKGMLSDNPGSMTFQGPNADKLKKWVSSVLGKSPEYIKGTADAASVTKNIYLSGGVPYTKYNMHAYNIFRNDAALNGYLPALKKFFSDPTGSKAADWLKNLPSTEKETLADLVDRGWQGHPMADTGHAVNIFEKGAESVSNAAGKKTLETAGKVLNKGQEIFEDPLFKRSLPSLGAQRTLEAFHRLEPELGREAALKAAAKIGNDFYGGVDTVLRNPTYKDLGRIGFLAPNWLESQLTKALSQWKGAAKTVVGKGTAVDKTYAKSLARSAALPSIGAITGTAVGKKLLGNRSSRDIAAIPMGEDALNKNRELPTLTTANEEIRIPVTAPIQTYSDRNIGALKDLLIKNRISTPAKAFINIVRGQNDFGDPLAGKDKYGKPISFGKGVLNYAEEASKPFQHQALQAMISYMRGKISREEAIAQGLELPLAYTRK